MDFNDMLSDDGEQVIINRVPKLQYEEYKNFSKDSNTFLLIPASLYGIVGSIHDIKQFNQIHHLF